VAWILILNYLSIGSVFAKGDTNQNVTTNYNEIKILPRLESAFNACVKVRAFFYQMPSKFAQVPKTGTGFFIDSESYILTNYHLVHNADLIKIQSNSHREYEAYVICDDEYNDLAILKVMIKSVGHSTPELSFNYQPQLGEQIFAIGNRNGKGLVVSNGIVSAFNQIIDNENDLPKISGALLSNIPATSGFSGGPLVNSDGKIFGLISAVTPITESNNGFLLSIPLYQVKILINKTLQKEKYEKPSFGLDVYETKDYPSIKPAWTHGAPDGLLINTVIEGSSCSKIDIIGGSEERYPSLDKGIMNLGGDILTEIDGVRVMTFAKLMYIISDKQIGDSVILTLYRKGQILQKEVLLYPLRK
jgi:serine protease Do